MTSIYLRSRNQLRGHPLCRQRGVTTVEMALLLPIFLLLLWLGSELIYHVQLQHRLHRATAALADTIANPALAATETLAPMLNRENATWLPLLGAMLEDRSDVPHIEALHTGLRVTHFLNSANGRQNIQTYTQGESCAPSLTDTSIVPGMLPIQSAQQEWIAIESCVHEPSRWLPGMRFLPGEINSHFIALRK